MNPQVQSFLSSAGLAAATSVASWAVSKGIIPGQDQATFANDLVAVAGAGAVGVIAWWKSRSHTPSALAAAVNSDSVPGVKAVASSSPSPAVSIDPKTGVIKPIPIEPEIRPRRAGGEWA